MYDGHLNKCKECTKKDVHSNRLENLERYRQHDRDRGARGNPKKYVTENQRKAHNALNNAIRDKRVMKNGCDICGRKAHAHHDDYLKPLEVRWLCAEHHQHWHMVHGEALNKY